MSKTRIFLSAVPLPMRCTDSARGGKVFRGFCPAQGVVLTRQEHTELCLTSGSHRGRGGPTTRAPAAQPATPPTLGTEATCSPLPATPPHLGTEALIHHGATTCSRQQKHVTEHNSHFLSIEAELEISLPEEPGLASPLEVLIG